MALHDPDVERQLHREGVVTLKGDWTSRDPAITALLARYGRVGVPLYLLYPADPSARPIVLPQLLTPADVLRRSRRWAGRGRLTLHQPRHDLDEIAGPVADVELPFEDAVPAILHRAGRAGQGEEIGAARDPAAGARLDGRGADLLES